MGLTAAETSRLAMMFKIHTGAISRLAMMFKIHTGAISRLAMMFKIHTGAVAISEGRFIVEKKTFILSIF